jgi:hypothetical protein
MLGMNNSIATPACYTFPLPDYHRHPRDRARSRRAFFFFFDIFAVRIGKEWLSMGFTYFI